MREILNQPATPFSYRRSVKTLITSTYPTRSSRRAYTSPPMQGINRSVSSFFPPPMASPSFRSYLLICDSVHVDVVRGKPWSMSALMMGQRCRIANAVWKVISGSRPRSALMQRRGTRPVRRWVTTTNWLCCTSTRSGAVALRCSSRWGVWMEWMRLLLLVAYTTSQYYWFNYNYSINYVELYLVVLVYTYMYMGHNRKVTLTLSDCLIHFQHIHSYFCRCCRWWWRW